MAKTKRKKQQSRGTTLRNQSILLFVLGLFLFAVAAIKGRYAWTWVHEKLFGLFGWSAFLLGPVLIYSSVVVVLGSAKKPKKRVRAKVPQVVLLVLLLGAITHVVSQGAQIEQLDFWEFIIESESIENKLGGGMLSGFLAWPLLRWLGTMGAGAVLAIAILALVMFTFGITIIDFYRAAKTARCKIKEISNQQMPWAPQNANSSKPDRRHGKSWLKEVENLEDKKPKKAMPPAETEADFLPQSSKSLFAEPEKEPAEKSPAAFEDKDELLDLVQENHTNKALAKQPPQPKGQEKPKPFDVAKEEMAQGAEFGDYNAPSLGLLNPPVEVDQSRKTVELKTTKEILERTLASFGVKAVVTDISYGPAVTRYELKPEIGVKISKITNLADDIALNLAAAGVRIEAPIPNKAAVGIEVPNKTTDVVNIREIIESEKFRGSKSRLTVALGKDITGEICVADLAKMPHLLVAGSTGAGKSVCINSLIISLIYKSSPAEVKLLLIDPKVVELNVYNGIPHLLVPVVTDPKKAAGALGWAVSEMQKRYKLFAELSVRDFKRYNELAAQDDELEKLPQIVIIIDELADLMMVAPNSVEDSICRLAQMARAAGMHLVIATQRPSVDIITGIIKANIPSRIAFAVSSQIDSRTIIDSSGAEKLLGHGDMLFMPVGRSKPVRIQGCFVSDKEIERVIDFVKESDEASYDEEVIEEIEKHLPKEKLNTPNGEQAATEGNDEDTLLHDAVRCVVEHGQASTSLLQRKLRIGFSRASRIMDEMEERGIVEEGQGSRPRKVLMSKEEWLEWESRKEG